MAEGFDKGETVLIEEHVQWWSVAAQVYADVNSDPGYPKVTLTDSAGVVRLNAEAMSNAATGWYEYYYDVPSSAPSGTWSGEVETQITDDAGTRKNLRQFWLKVK